MTPQFLRAVIGQRVEQRNRVRPRAGDARAAEAALEPDGLAQRQNLASAA